MGRRTVSRRWWIAASAAVLVVATAALAITFWPSTGSSPVPVRPRSAVAVRPAPVSEPTSTAAPSTAAPSTAAPSAPPAPVKPVAKIQAVGAATPTQFTFRGPHFTIKAHVCGMADVRPLDPPGAQHHTVCWVDHGFGVAPGSDTATTYVLGHAWAEDRLEVLNQASTRATEQIINEHARVVDGIPIYPVTKLNGDTITLATGKGRLTYTVRRVFGVAKDQAGNVRSLMDESTRHRLALITCAERNGVDYDYDVIVEAYLSAATPNRS